MPFTPFHMGAALIVKPVTRSHFSLLTFGISQRCVQRYVKSELSGYIIDDSCVQREATGV